MWFSFPYLSLEILKIFLGIFMVLQTLGTLGATSRDQGKKPRKSP